MYFKNELISLMTRCEVLKTKISVWENTLKCSILLFPVVKVEIGLQSSYMY